MSRIGLLPLTPLFMQRDVFAKLTVTWLPPHSFGSAHLHCNERSEVQVSQR